MNLREEQLHDHAAIHQLTAVAFKPKKFSDGTEPDVIDRLREAGDLTLSLVAVDNKRIIGHVAFSPVTIGTITENWYGLGPISVHPDEQRKGIGSSLIEHGFKRLREISAHGCALIGDPKYYSRFGFVSDGNVHYENLPSEHVQWITFNQTQPTGQLVFKPAFS